MARSVIIATHHASSLFSNWLSTGFSPTSRQKNHYDAGFTLIEVMIVVVIIGLAASLVVLNLPSASQNARSVADQVRSDFAALADMTLLSGKSHAITIGQNNYQLLERKNGEWVPLAAKANVQTFPDTVSVSVSINNAPLSLPSILSVQRPQLLFTPDGFLPDFGIYIGNTNTPPLYLIASNDQGGISISDNPHKKSHHGDAS